MGIGRPTFVSALDLEMGFEKIVRIAHARGGKLPYIKTKGGHFSPFTYGWVDAGYVSSLTGQKCVPKNGLKRNGYDVYCECIKNSYHLYQYMVCIYYW